MFYLLYHMKQILAILVLDHGLCQLAHAFGGNPAFAIGDAFETGNLETLALFNDFNKRGSLTEGVVRAGVQPCETTAKGLYLEFTIFEEFLVYSGYFQLAAGGGFDLLGHINHLIGIEVEANHCII